MNISSRNKQIPIYKHIRVVCKKKLIALYNTKKKQRSRTHNFFFLNEIVTRTSAWCLLYMFTYSTWIITKYSYYERIMELNM